PEELLADANGALQTVRQALRLIGPLLGAALYTVVGGWAVAVVAMTGLLVAAATIAALRVREARPPRAELRWLAEVGAGLRHVVGLPALRRAVVGVALALLVLGFLESLIFAYVDRGLHRPPGFVGVLAAVQGTGGVLGGLLAARVVRAVGELVALALGVLGFGLGCLGFSHPNLPLGIAAMGVAGVGLPIATVGFQTLLQRLTPAELIGRVSATADALISGPQAASIAIGAVLVTVVDYRLLLAAMGVTLVAVAGYLWTGRRLVAAAASGGAGQLGEALLDLEDGRVG
ncbi:MAG TPA: MFS transporter, partial [Micromonosporaceae bacterium]|nr:MFS transporter [Micromonosporaceae bacterium]